MKNILLENIFDPKTQQVSAYGAGLLQGTAYSRLNNKLSKAIYTLDVTIPEWKLLGQLSENRDVKLSELAELLSYDPPMVTKLVKQLEKKKMVLRAHDKHDERAKIISITPKGSEIVKEAEPLVRKAMGELLQGVSREDLMNYLKVLSMIVKNTQV